MLQAELEPVHNLSSGFAEFNCAVVITKIPPNAGKKLSNLQAFWIKSSFALIILSKNINNDESEEFQELCFSINKCNK